MVSSRMLMERSLLPRKVKIASLSQMVIRRCSNQVGGGEKNMKTKHLSKLMYKMKKSGYSQEERMQVLVTGMRGFRRMETDQKAGKRPEWMGERGRRLKKLTGCRTWYLKRKRNKNAGGRKKLETKPSRMMLVKER